MDKLISPSDKVFVAGAGGMVGQAVVRALKKNQYGMSCNGGSLLTPSRKQLDLSNFNEVTDWFGLHKPDIVILAAAKVGGIYANEKYPADFLLNNLKIQNNVIESAYKYHARRLLFLGSSCIYPKYSSQPISEESLLTGSLEPTNQWYAIAKISGLKLCQSLKKQYNFDCFSLMPTNLYGPGDNYHPENSHVIPGLIRKFHDAKHNNLSVVKCWGSGNVLREFLHVDDLANAIVFLLERYKPGSSDSECCLNVGSGNEIYIHQLASLIAELFNYEGLIEWDVSYKDGTPRKKLDISKIQALGWNPNIDLKDGLRDAISDFKKSTRST